jgi:hypothetical protein
MMARSYVRKLPTTGYWIFICDLSLWFADEFLHGPENQLDYKISNHHAADFRSGQLGVLRLNDDRRPVRLRRSEQKLRKGIYAILEVTGNAHRRPDPDVSFYADAALASELKWRVPVRLIKNLILTPILAEQLPTEDGSFRYIHRALQTATIPIDREALEYIVDLAGGVDEPVESSSLSPDDPDAVRTFEDRYADVVPVIREVHSRRIERGSIGVRVKRFYGYRCQVCSALGVNPPIAFVDFKGNGFAEAHHVVPVSTGQLGSLSHLNIMVLCPNHHRQAHHGQFDIERNATDHWQVKIDGTVLRIEKPALSTIS